MTREENELLTRTGPGTRCGELMRRYWQPAALSEELPAGGAPLPIKLLSEDLVLFRDDHGRAGLLGLHCAHRGADLSYARVEDGGLRCIYHGWLYDRRGRVIDMPGEAEGGARMRDSIRHLAYPCEERAGVIFAYMGPGEPPLLPNYEFLTASEERVYATKLFQDCNYLQAHEASVDLLHVSFLHLTHKDRQPVVEPPPAGKISGRGNAPGLETIEVELTHFGLKVCKVRSLGPEMNYIRVASLALPSLTVVPGRQDGIGGYSVNWHVPIDETHHWKYTFDFNKRGPIDPEVIERNRAAKTNYRPKRNKANRYLQNRESMKTESFCGMGSVFQDQDSCAAEGMGPTQDRTQEHLMPSDVAILMGRKLLLKAIQDVEQEKDPPNVIREAKENRFENVVTTSGTIPRSQDWRLLGRPQDETHD